ncbi:hypothetical protein RclHR1_30640003 [Rhizophagus clarus]|uniref:Uncharacterized protein n=1 Tax=Rhizophagus clarus TaxID=94130 RepID=A0A2Z6RKV7_9GLOM|nr:hypothetical protein RclHR1_30640003 [Rhizophagus clarus]
MKIETKLVTDKEGLHTLHTSIQSHGERVRNSYDNCEEANVRVSKFIFEQDKPKDDHDETKRQQKSSNERGSNKADDEKDKVKTEARDSIFISEENDDSGFFSLGSQPISFCDTTTKVQELPGRNKDEIQKTITDGSENKPFLVSEGEYAYLQEILNEDVRLPTPNKRGNEFEEDVSTRKKAKKTVKSTYSVEHPRSRNSEKSSFEDPSVENAEDDEEIKFDLANISIELEQEPTCKWEVGCINVTDRFRQYQKEVITKAEREGLKYDNIYELLALSSIMVLCWPCPYPMFTKREWKEITNVNPYFLNEPPLSHEISLSLYNATRRHLVNKNIFMDCGSSDLSRAVACSFNCVPDVAPIKLSEDEHTCMFLHPISRPLFTGPEKEYELRLNRADKGSKKRPDLSCTVDGVSILNSEIKPLGHTPLQQKKDRLKVQLKARKSINLQLRTKRGPGEAGIFLNMGDLMESFFMDLQYDGLYRSWPFLTTRLVTDKTTIPLAESAISHLVVLEERVGKISEDYKYRKHPSGETTPPTQVSFMRKLPESPQVKKLIH